MADDKSDVIGIMLVVINDGVIAADPFCMISKACTPQSVKLTGNEYFSIVRYVLAGIDKGYISADTFKEGLDVVVSNKIKLPIPASHLR